MNINDILKIRIVHKQTFWSDIPIVDDFTIHLPNAKFFSRALMSFRGAYLKLMRHTPRVHLAVLGKLH
jgi:hypothetical protein